MKNTINFKEYQRINSEVSSEMFTALMRVLHETLPCSKNYFHIKRAFRRKQKLAGIQIPGEVDNDDNIKTIASPKLVRGLSLGKSPSRNKSNDGLSTSDNDGYRSRFSHN